MSLRANYTCASVYDWQRQWFDIRQRALDLIKILIELYEAFLNGSEKRIQRASRKVGSKDEDFFQLYTAPRQFPRRNNDLFNSPAFTEDIKVLDEWLANWRTFFKQAHLVIKPMKSNDPFIANMNLQEMLQGLAPMQQGFDFISTSTHPYFDTSKITAEETQWYRRLNRLVYFCMANPNDIGKTPNPRRAIPKWLHQQERMRIEAISKSLESFELSTGKATITPRHTVEEGITRKAILGIEELKWEQSDDLFGSLFIPLLELTDLDIDVYSLIFVVNGHVKHPVALAIPRTFLQRVKRCFDTGGELETSDFGNPYPEIIEPAMLEVLEGVSSASIEEDTVSSSIGSIIMSLWFVSESRQRLSSNEEVESKWLSELEDFYREKVDKATDVLVSAASPKISSKYREIADEILSLGGSFTDDSFQHYYSEDILMRMLSTDDL